MNRVSADQVASIVKEAKAAGYVAAKQYFDKTLGGVDQYCCGFAWVVIYGVRGNTKLGRALNLAGFKPNYGGGLQLWNPSGFGCQNIDTLEVGAQAAAAVFKKYGFEAYMGSRMD